MTQKAGWSTEEYTYILWLALPRKDRTPPTQKALAKKLGVGRRTLVRWKQKPEFQNAVYSEIRHHLDWRLPEILGALGNKAEGGDVPAIKMVLELTGRFKMYQTLTLEIGEEYGGDKLKEIWQRLKKFEEQLFSGDETDGGQPEAISEREG